MRKAEVIILSVMAVLWLSAGAIATQKAYYKVSSGMCGRQPVLVPVVLDKDCIPNVIVRACDEASDNIDVNCSWRFDENLTMLGN